MGTRRIPREALFGVFYVRKPNGVKWDSYYNTLNVLRSLFEDKEFNRIVTGFYLNVAGNFDSVRISYFVDKPNTEEAISTFKHFFNNNGLLEIQDSKFPTETLVAESYGGGVFEDRFRNYLVLETQIGLELINSDLLHARILFATYRWQVRKASLPLREHFESTFKKHSRIYTALSDDEKSQFFADLAEWPNPPQVDWAHMMVNLVLGCDWNYVFSDPNYLTPGQPLSISKINMIVRELGFQIPPDWRP